MIPLFLSTTSYPSRKGRGIPSLKIPTRNTYQFINTSASIIFWFRPSPHPPTYVRQSGVIFFNVQTRGPESEKWRGCLCSALNTSKSQLCQLVRGFALGSHQRRGEQLSITEAKAAMVFRVRFGALLHFPCVTLFPCRYLAKYTAKYLPDYTD